MSPRCGEIAVYFLLFLPVLICGYSLVYMPSGVLMCIERCGRCQSLLFSKSHLVCKVLGNRSPDQDPLMPGQYLFRTYKNPYKRFLDDKMKCYQQEGNTYLCWVDTVKQREMKNLLILPSGYTGSRPQAKQLNLYSHTVSTESISSSNTETIAYISALNKLLMAKPKKRKLTSLDLETRALQPIMKTEVIKGLAVDEIRQLVFMTVSNPENMVKSMTTSGEDIKTVTTLKTCSVAGVAVDPEHSTFSVVCLHEKLLFFNGLHVEPVVIDKGQIKSSICIDAERGVLYYVKGSMLLRRNMSNDASPMKFMVRRDMSAIMLSRLPNARNDMPARNVVHLRLPTVKNLVVVGKQLYVSNGQDLVVVYEQNRKHIRVKTGYSKAVSSICFCAIP